jgi:lysozyme
MPSKELLDALRRDEGLRLKAYRCTAGVLTIGYGHTGPEVHEGLTWTKAQAEAALLKDVEEHNAVLDRAIPWWRSLDPVRQNVVSNMHFNLGWDNPRTPGLEGLSGFVNTLAAIKAGEWEKAAAGMLASKWARQVKGRAVRLAEEMRSGKAGG